MHTLQFEFEVGLLVSAQNKTYRQSTIVYFGANAIQ